MQIFRDVTIFGNDFEEVLRRNANKDKDIVKYRNTVKEFKKGGSQDS